MTKEVLISVKGLQYSLEADDSDDQRIETLNRGIYAFRNGHDYISYEECYDADISVKNLIKFSDDFVEVTKKGPFGVHMLFEEGQKNYTNYKTPYGDIVIGIETDKIKIVRTEDEITVIVSYDMEMNYQFLAKSEIEIHISSI